jgi:hypothetical protein
MHCPRPAEMKPAGLFDLVLDRPKAFRLINPVDDNYCRRAIDFAPRSY